MVRRTGERSGGGFVMPSEPRRYRDGSGLTVALVALAAKWLLVAAVLPSMKGPFLTE